MIYTTNTIESLNSALRKVTERDGRVEDSVTPHHRHCFQMDDALSELGIVRGKLDII